jgi:hypothetical protein
VHSSFVPFVVNGRSLWLVVALSLGWVSVVDGQQLLDRVVARVGGLAITQTDVEAALGLGLVDAPPGEDAIASGTRQLIDRQLLLTEVSRFPPPEPSPAAIAELVVKMKARAGARYGSLVQRTGLDDQRLRGLARDTLRIQAYVDQRFGTTAQVGLQDARDYYDAHRQLFTRNGVLLPFELVEIEAREAASLDRRRATVARWIDDLRARGDVVEVTRRP